MFDICIIIPHYNAINSLKKLLKTIPPKPNIQVIVIDDNSQGVNRHHSDLISLFKELNLSIFSNSTSKKGAGACRNIGIKNSNSKWIIFADADDFFNESFYISFMKYVDSDYDIVMFHANSINVDRNSLSTRHERFNRILNLDLSKNKNLLTLRYKLPNPICKMIRADIIKENKIFFEEVIAENDRLFSTKVGHVIKKFKISEAEIYCITESINSLSRSNKIDKAFSRAKENIKWYKFLRKNLSQEDFQVLKPKGNIHKSIYDKGFIFVVLIYIYYLINGVKIFWLSSLFKLLRKN